MYDYGWSGVSYKNVNFIFIWKSIYNWYLYYTIYIYLLTFTNAFNLLIYMTGWLEVIDKVHLTPTTQNNKKLDTVVWLKVSATIQTYSNIYENHLEGITFALRQKVIELGHIVNGTTKLPTNSNLMVTCWRRKMMQYVHELKAVLQLSSLVLFNATLTFPFMRLL